MDSFFQGRLLKIRHLFFCTTKLAIMDAIAVSSGYLASIDKMSKKRSCQNKKRDRKTSRCLRMKGDSSGDERAKSNYEFKEWRISRQFRKSVEVLMPKENSRKISKGEVER